MKLISKQLDFPAQFVLSLYGFFVQKIMILFVKWTQQSIESHEPDGRTSNPMSFLPVLSIIYQFLLKSMKIGTPTKYTYVGVYV